MNIQTRIWLAWMALIFVGALLACVFGIVDLIWGGGVLP